jgi:hypothetical protein
LFRRHQVIREEHRKAYQNKWSNVIIDMDNWDTVDKECGIKVNEHETQPIGDYAILNGDLLTRARHDSLFDKVDSALW